MAINRRDWIASMPPNRVAFGTMNAFGTFNGLYRNPIPRERAEVLVDAVYDLGVRILDTAPIYCRGLAEQRIAELASAEFEIWTKVGVSIRRTLPQIDFAFDELSLGLQESLKRLCRDTVEIAFLHNPDSLPTRAIEVDRFARWAINGGLTKCIGISVLGSKIPQKLLKFDELEVVMIERRHLPAIVANHRDWLERRRVVVRSIFAGGSELKKVPSHRRADYIDQTLGEIDQLWPVWRYVIAPRTLKQTLDYRLATSN